MAATNTNETIEDGVFYAVRTDAIQRGPAAIIRVLKRQLGEQEVGVRWPPAWELVSGVGEFFGQWVSRRTDAVQVAAEARGQFGNPEEGARPTLRRLVAGFQPRRPGFEPGSVHVGFVVDKVVLGQVFSDYFSSPANSHSTICSTIIIVCSLGLVGIILSQDCSCLTLPAQSMAYPVSQPNGLCIVRNGMVIAK
jgi:hypothetical protein